MAGLLKRGLKKSIILLAMVSLAVICFAACGKKEVNDPQAAAVSKDYVYRMQDVDLGVKDQNINQIVRAGDKIYAYGYSWSDDGSDSAIVFFELKEDGTIGESHRVPLMEYASINSISMDDDANIYCIKNDYHPADMPQEEPSEEDGEDTAADGIEDDMAFEDAGEVEYIDDYYLVKMTLSGEELFSVKLNDIPDFAQLGADNGYLYVRDLILDKERGIYVNSYGIFMKFDFEGNYLGVMSQNRNQSVFESANFITLEDGGLIAVFYEENGMSMATVDLETGTIGEKNQFPGSSYNYFFYAGKGYDLYLTDSYGVYGYNIGDSDKKQIMSFIDSDLDIYGLYQVIGMNGEDFFATYDDMETGNNVLALFTKVPPEEVKEKQVIVLAMADSNWNVRRSAIKFNKENEDYRISILDYGSIYATDGDYMAGINRLNTDIASGKVPDILLVNYAMPMESYISKGLFEDFKPYIEKDEELDINNFMPNILEAFSVNGKMYSLVPSYSIHTILAKASDVGEERGWTVQEAMDLLASKPEGTQLLESTTKSTMLMY
ncbi:MAG: extracellular solute-binding protein, partial [Lachnospiraceae bacterium]|nr:extracellular solute-binding protein [Lachnospiraceae bacterium]